MHKKKNLEKLQSSIFNSKIEYSTIQGKGITYAQTIKCHDCGCGTGDVLTLDPPVKPKPVINS